MQNLMGNDVLTASSTVSTTVNSSGTDTKDWKVVFQKIGEWLERFQFQVGEGEPEDKERSLASSPLVEEGYSIRSGLSSYFSSFLSIEQSREASTSQSSIYAGLSCSTILYLNKGSTVDLLASDSEYRDDREGRGALNENDGTVDQFSAISDLIRTKVGLRMSERALTRVFCSATRIDAVSKAPRLYHVTRDAKIASIAVDSHASSINGLTFGSAAYIVALDRRSVVFSGCSDANGQAVTFTNVGTPNTSEGFANGHIVDADLAGNTTFFVAENDPVTFLNAGDNKFSSTSAKGLNQLTFRDSTNQDIHFEVGAALPAFRANGVNNGTLRNVTVTISRASVFNDTLGTNLTRDTLAAPHPSPLPQGETEQETSLCDPAPLLPHWEKGLGDEGLSMLSMGSLSRFELMPDTLNFYAVDDAKGCFLFDNNSDGVVDASDTCVYLVVAWFSNDNSALSQAMTNKITASGAISLHESQSFRLHETGFYAEKVTKILSNTGCNMIQNEHQYKISQGKIKEIEESLDQLYKEKDSLHPRQFKMRKNGLQGMLAEIQEEIKEYDALKEKPITIEIQSFAEIPIALIKARIALGMTQKDLAEKLGMKEQQIQRYESNQYGSAGFHRLAEVAEALEVTLNSSLLTLRN
jgi:HTH-type transcriptional regulator / antitoxin HipB